MATKFKRHFHRITRLSFLNLKVIFVVLILCTLCYILWMLGYVFSNVITLLNTTIYKGLFVSKLIFEISTNLIDDGVFFRGKTISFRDYNREISCIGCFKHDFRYVINNEHVCTPHYTGQQVDLFIVILTEHDNWRARHAIRKTWLSYSKNNTANVRYVFLLGEVLNDKHRRMIAKENNVYHDIIKEDFLDTYMNLTYKTVMGLKFATTYCNHAAFVLKTDDDVFINIQNVLRLLRNHGYLLQNAVGGSCSGREGPIRNKKSKWYASARSFSGSQYPNFCSGTAYLTSMNVTRQVYAVSPDVPFFHLEDVYFALCMEKLGYHTVDFPGFMVHDWFTFDLCTYRKKSVFSVHSVSPVKMYAIWHRNC